MADERCVSWWLDASALPGRELWARLRVTADGRADVLDCDGRVQQFGNLEEAEHWLREDEYAPLREFVDDGDIPGDTTVPTGGDDLELLKGMIRVHAS